MGHAGAPEFAEFRKKSAELPIEAVGKELRGLMAWVKSQDNDYVGAALPADPS